MARALLFRLIFRIRAFVCRIFGHRICRERLDRTIYTGCIRCWNLKSIDLMKYSAKRPVTGGDIKRRMAVDPRDGYEQSFLLTLKNRNWVKMTAFAVFLNKSGHTRSKYGSVLVKRRKAMASSICISRGGST